MNQLQALDGALDRVELEVKRAISKHPHFNSLHEVYGVLLEEIEELKEQVFMQRDARSQDAVTEELLHVAAVCMRALVDRWTGECRV